MPPGLAERIAELEHEINEVEKSIPAHSVPASMLIRLEELEEELDELRAQLQVRAKRQSTSSAV